MLSGMGAFFVGRGAAPQSYPQAPASGGQGTQSGAERAKRTTVTPARAWRTEGMTSTQSS